MATQTTSIACNHSSDAAFQAWNTFIDSAIIAMGWAHSADTGQMNPATTNRAGISTYAGYIIYKMADALQATAPVYLRIDFGQGATATYGNMKFQMSTATDGAGTLTGNISALATFTWTGTIAASNCHISGSTSSLRMSLYPTNTTALGLNFAVGRDCDASGVNTGYGFWTLWNMGNSILWSMHYVPQPAYGPTCAAETKATTLISGQTSQGSGGTIGVGVLRPVAGAMRNPILGWLICSRGDFTTEVTTSVTIYGGAHTYLALTTPSNLSTSAVGNNTAAGQMMLWE